MSPGERVADGLVRPLLPQTVREGGTLHFDDLGAQVAEQPAQFSARDDDAKVEYTDTRQRPAPDDCVRLGLESRC